MDEPKCPPIHMKKELGTVWVGCMHSLPECRLCSECFGMIRDYYLQVRSH